jgi:hypothetical protein
MSTSGPGQTSCSEVLAHSGRVEICRDLELRQMHVRDKLERRNEPVEAVYFPLTCLRAATVFASAG